MKEKILLLLAVSFLCLSCTHKSGYKNTGSKKMVASSPAIYSNSRDVMLPRSIFAKYNKAVFMVFTTDGNHQFQGSGFFVNSHGLAVSNYHVFKGTYTGAEVIKLMGDNNTAYKINKVLYKEDESDFIIFQVDCDNTKYIPIAAQKPGVGDKVYAIGSPKGLENTFSSGEISQLRDQYLMQINVSIDHGSSGGALINEYGQVVGITSGTLDASSNANLNYAWSIEAVKKHIRLKEE